MKKSLFLVLLGLLSSCGNVHLFSDPVKIDHYVHIDIQGIVNYCQTVCHGNEVCFEDCYNRFVSLLSDPELCVDLGSCTP